MKETNVFMLKKKSIKLLSSCKKFLIFSVKLLFKREKDEKRRYEEI